MKRLTLIRHAKSSWKKSSIADIDRPLNHRGLDDAPMMGRRLRQANIRFDSICSSPAKRAISTAELLSAELEYPEERISRFDELYTADWRQVQAVIAALSDDIGHAAIICHNPAITDLANATINEQIDNIPTCGVVQVQLDIEKWPEFGPGRGELLDFDYPKRDRC